MAASYNYRQQDIRTKFVAKATEKLASGLRINQAADDAAGLSISEKMRGQINGLAQAKYNIQAGISLLQTADAGMGEIANPNLVRLRELAIQAATDTVTTTERAMIQQEVTQILYQGQQSVSKVVAQATDGHQHNISYQTHPHRIPNTTQLTIKVGSYSGATQKQLRFATALPTTATVGDTLHVNIALVDGNATEDVTNKASIYANNTPTAATITLKQPGNMVVNVVYNGQTLHHVVSVTPKVLAYPIEGIEPLLEKTTTHLTKQWVITFNHPVKKYDQLRVLNQYGVEVAVALQRQDNQVTVTPLVPYTKGEVYYLLLQGVESMTQILPPQSMKFTIE